MQKIPDEEKELRRALASYETSYRKLAKAAKEEVLRGLSEGKTLSKVLTKTVSTRSDFAKLENEALRKLLIRAYADGCGKKLSSMPLKEQDTIINKIFHRVWVEDSLDLVKRLEKARYIAKNKIMSSVRATRYHSRQVAKYGENLYALRSTKKWNVDNLHNMLSKMRASARLAANGDVTIIGKLMRTLSAFERKVRVGDTRNKTRTFENIRKLAKDLEGITTRKAVEKAFMEKVAYWFERIARTEAQRVWYEAFREKYDSDDTVIFYQWQLSSRHRIYDICDVRHKENVGYGSGIYPKEHVPRIPQHPHCMCRLIPIFNKNTRGT